ncbi:MAG: hypothetical protein HDR41_00705 [Lactobacillus sp.]|nr:hypothetical protein [Lactobacillus sp.]
MKHRILVTALAAVPFLGVGTITSFSHPQKVEAKFHVRAKKYTYVDKNSITYENKTGNMCIDKIYGYRMLDNDGNYWYSRIIIHGIFTNNSKRKIKPTDFFSRHFKVFQTTKNAWHELNPVAPLPDAPTDYFDDLGEDGDSYVKPHKYVEFAVSDDDLPVKLYKHQIIAVRAYNDAYSNQRRLDGKYFRLGSIESTMSADDQEIANEEDDE